MRVARWPVLAATLVLAGCSAEAGDSTQEAGAGTAIAYDGTRQTLPAHAPARFAFGEVATDERVAAWDIDVPPDGAGLPAGSGSVAEGREVFATHCVACHGPTGTEGPNDRLVNTERWGEYPMGGRAVGNYWPYATTLYDYIRKAMPQLTPGILTHDQVYAVVAWILYLNEIIPDDAVMDAESLPAVVMPARDRFVVDDRVGGAGPIR